MNKELIEHYEVNPHTLMIKPIINENQVSSEIIEIDCQFVSNERPLKIIKRSCEYFGSNYEGRRRGTQQLVNITHKAPIIVDPHTSIYFFPTTSPTKPHCIWVAHDHVISYRKGDGNHQTIVTFRNNEEYLIPISYTSFGTQLSRTATLRIKYQQNIERMEMYVRQARQPYLFAPEYRKPYRTND